jgi:branched-chain amino acid transport system permease protein
MASLLAVAISLPRALAIGVYVYAQRLYNSPIGRLLRAVRDDEEAARALGKDIATARRDAMIIGSALAGLAGTLYAINPLLGGGSVAAQDLFNRLSWTFWPWALMILGGMASNRGITVAVIAVWVTILWPIRIYKHELASALGVESLGIDPGYFANALEYLLMGALLILVIFFRPQGIIPEPPSRTLPVTEILRIRESLVLPRQPECRVLESANEGFSGKRDRG